MLEARDGLLVGGSRQGPGAGLLPVVDRPLEQARRLGVLRLDLGRGVAGALQQVEETGVQGDALDLEQALVGGIADQGVLEQIGGVGRRAPAKHQLGLHQAAHRVGQLGLGQVGERGDGGVIEGAADDGGGLGHHLDGLQPIEPRHQRVVQRGRDRQGAQGTVEVIRVGLLAEHGRLDHRLGHLLDEQGHAVGPRGDLVEENLGQALAARDAADDRLGRRPRQPVQRQPRHHRVAGEGGDEGRAGGDQQEDAGALHAIERELDQLQRRRVDPVRVLDHPQHWLLAGEPGELADEGGQRLVAALRRRQRQRAVARLAVQTHECGNERRGGAHIVHGRAEQRLQPVQAPLRACPLRRSRRRGAGAGSPDRAPSRHGRASTGSAAGNAARRPLPRAGPR